MLHLKPRIDLEEVKGAFRVEEELDRAGATVPALAHERESGARHRFSQRGVDGGARRLLDDFLMAPLHRALALAERDSAALPVAQYLDLDMARRVQVFLDEDRRIGEPGERFLRCARESAGKIGDLRDHAHSPAPASSGGFHEVRRLEALRREGPFELACSKDRRARESRGPRAWERRAFARALSPAPCLPGASSSHHAGRRSRMPAPSTRSAKARILREEPVARVKEVGAKAPGRSHDGLAVEEASHFEDFVRLTPNEGFPILGCRDHRDPIAALSRGAENPPGDLAAVRDEKFHAASFTSWPGMFFAGPPPAPPRQEAPSRRTPRALSSPRGTCALGRWLPP